MAAHDEGARRRAVFDRLVPADAWPAASEAGLSEYLDRLAADPATASEHAAVSAALEAVDAAARGRHGAAVDDLPPADVDALLGELAPVHLEVLVTAAARAYYGDGRGPGARMVGYRPQPARGPGAPVVRPALATTPLAQAADVYDVVVVGAGAGGGVAACVLAEGGARVLVVDRGEAPDVDELDRDHLRNHRSKAHGLGLPGEAETRIDVDGRHVDRPWDPGWHAGASVVGGGTRVFQGTAWRFLTDDLRMASRYGVPDGSSLADWPLTAEDLEPHWTWVEWEVGVAGDPDAHPAAAPGPTGYPMPPFPLDAEGRALADGARALGLAVGAPPVLINTVPRHGRARCVRCGECVGFACPVEAKNGTHATVLPRALAAGATLVTGTRAVEVTASGGRVDGVRLVDGHGTERTIGAGHVVLACGAIETARLLLASRAAEHPDGLGNAGDQVGRHLQGHAFVSAFGLFDHDVHDSDGPGATIATLDLAHGNVDDAGAPLVGGGVVGDEMVRLPIVHWAWALPPDAPRWGLAGKAAMRDTYRRTGHLFAQVQEVPRPGNRVTVDPARRDRLGMPLVRLHGESHPETIRTARHIGARAEAWLAASGAGRTWIDGVPTGLHAGTHQAGTCRMGTDPATSVVDRDGRVHGHPNLWVADASVHVTNGSVNPVLTIMALAHRTAGRLLAT